MTRNVTVKVVGDRNLIEAFRLMTDRAADMRRPLDEWGDHLAESERRAFESAGQSLGHGGWAPTDPAYTALKVAHGGSPQLLVNTGRLRDSVTRRPMGVERIGRHGAEFGSDVPYAEYIQQGTRYMPPRPFLEVTPALDDKLHELLEEHLVEGWDEE